MPELFTREPDAVLKTLRNANACQPGPPSPALAACPQDRFCALPGGGELCVRGPEGLTQAVVEQVPPKPEPREITGLEVLSVAVVFIVGIALGRYWPRARPR